MIHIATVHWNTDRWIGIQQRYLRQHISRPYRVYGWLNGVPAAAQDAFYYACSEPVTPHPVKLNILGDIIYFASNRDDDILIFLDGDAFPIADIEELLTETLAAYPLIAVQRRENNGDIQPHPSFCATTVKFWKAIKGDWSKGHRWKNDDGQWVTDTGANLLKELDANRITWHPLLRSNLRNLHPVFFGIYGGAIYHHGAGFRGGLTRRDASHAARGVPRGILSAVMPVCLRLARWRRLRANRALSEQVFRRIEKDPLFYTEFM